MEGFTKAFGMSLKGLVDTSQDTKERKRIVGKRDKRGVQIRHIWGRVKLHLVGTLGLSVQVVDRP